MTVYRRRDSREAVAFQVVGRFVFVDAIGDRRQEHAGSWIVREDGQTEVYPDDQFEVRYSLRQLEG